MKNNVLLKIQHQLPLLSKKEQHVAEYVLANVETVTTSTIHETAKHSQVSVATVIRFCRSVGLNGFPELKLALSAQQSVSEEILYEELAPDDSFETLQTKLTQRLTSTLTLTNDVLDEEKMRTAIQLIAQSTQIIVFGLGASRIAAEDFFQKFLRIGNQVITHSDIHVTTTLLAAQPKQKLLVLISNSGEKTQIEQLLQIAKSLSMPVIAITGNDSSVLAQQADVVLLHNTLEVNGKIRTAATTSVMAQLYVIDMLYYYFLLSDYTTYSKPIIRTHDTANSYLK